MPESGCDLSAEIDKNRTVKATALPRDGEGWFMEDGTPGAMHLQHIGDGGAFVEAGDPGIRHTILIFNCPGCGRFGSIPVGRTKPPIGPSWEMSGEGLALTLKPSINCVGCCGWHGFLTDGVFVSC